LPSTKEPALGNITRQFVVLVGLLSASLFLGSLRAEALNTQTLLFHAIDERLSHMEDVALFKAQNQIPVEDIEREKIVLSDSRELANLFGLEPESMEGFFQAQINTAKAIQYRFRAELQTAVIPTDAIDLSSEIRPALDRLGKEIVVLFSKLLQEPHALHEGSRTSFMQILDRRLLDDADKNALFNAMIDVRRI